MKKYLGAALVAVLMTLGLQASTSPADARITKTGCATKAEWRTVKYGQTLYKARYIIDHKGKLVDENSYSDGDEYRTYKFRQCNRSWSNSYLYVTVSLSERRYWVEDIECYDWDGDGWEEDCEDYGYYETYYDTPFRVRSKDAYWS